MSNRQDNDSSNATIDPAHLERIRSAVHETAKVTSIATLRAAIMDVIDAGCHHQDGMSHEWRLNSGSEEFANEQRCAFADAIATRITELQAVPLLYDDVLLAKLADAQVEYHRGYRNGWEDAMADREEVRRLAQEGKR
jgi:hypothetical protein